eukprot:1030651-Prymnesium_polylepis.1
MQLRACSQHACLPAKGSTCPAQGVPRRLMYQDIARKAKSRSERRAPSPRRPCPSSRTPRHCWSRVLCVFGAPASITLNGPSRERGVLSSARRAFSHAVRVLGDRLCKSRLAAAFSLALGLTNAVTHHHPAIAPAVVISPP